MPYKERKFTCTGCGKTFWRRRSRNWTPKCFSCAIEASVDNMKSMMSKKGPAYERWLNGMRSAIERESREYGQRQSVNQCDDKANTV